MKKGIMSYILKICPTRFVLILAGIKERKMKGAYKFAMLILNVVSAALCVIAIAGIISGPLIETKATVTINQTVVDLIFGKDDGNGKTDGENNSTDGATVTPVSETEVGAGDNAGSGATDGTGGGSGDASSDADDGKAMIRAIFEEMAKEKVKLSFKFCLSNDVFFKAFFAKDNSPADELLNGIVDSIMNDEMKEEINKVKASITKGTTKTLVYTEFDNLRKNNPGFDEIFEGKDSKQVLAEAGVTDEYVDEKVNEVHNALTTDKTVSEAATKVTDTVKDIFKKLEESEYGQKNPEVFAAIDTQWDGLEDNVTQMLVYLVILGEGEENMEGFDSSKVTDEMIEARKNDVININDAVDKIIINMLSGALNSGNNGNGDGNNGNNGNGDGNENKTGNENQNGGSAEEKSFFVGDYSFTVAALETVYPRLPKISDTAEAGAENSENSENAESVESGGDNGGESTSESGSGSAGDGETAEDAYEQIRTLLKNKINEVITEQYKGYMLTAMKVVGGLIVFFAAVWAYLILKLIVNSLTGRMKTKMKLAYMFGWMPGLNLVVIPTVMFRIFTTSNFITQKLFTDLSVIESIGNTLNLSFASGGVFGFYAGVGLIAVAIVRFILKGALSGGNED